MYALTKPNTWFKMAVTLLVAALLFVGFWGTSHAADPTASQQATITINPGSRTITSGGDVTLPSDTLNGAQQTTALALSNLGIVDASGSGAGWHVTVDAPQVSAGSKTLPTGSVQLDPVQSVSKVDTTSSATPAISTSSVAPVDTGSVTLLDAAAGDGMGSYSAALKNLTVIIPASAYAGTYTTTLTYNLSTAP